MTPNTPAEIRFLTLKQVGEKLARRKTWLYDQVAHNPDFPRPRVLNGRKVFLAHEIDAFMLGQIIPEAKIERVAA